MLAVFVLLISSGCAARSPIPRYTAPAAGTTPLASTASFLGPAYKLDTGDRLQIRFPYHDELDSLTIVRPDGRLTVTGLGEFQAFGLTTDELERDIYRRASLTHRNPETYVLLAEAREVKAYVGGEVQRPGYVAVRPGLTSLRAVLGFFALRGDEDIEPPIANGPADMQPSDEMLALLDILGDEAIWEDGTWEGDEATDLALSLDESDELLLEYLIAIEEEEDDEEENG